MARKQRSPRAPRAAVAPASPPSTAAERAPAAREGRAFAGYLFGVGLAAIAVYGAWTNRRSVAPTTRSEAPPRAAPLAASVADAHPGRIEARDVWIEPGEDHIRPQDCDELGAAWGAPDRDALRNAMTAAGLGESARAAAEEAVVCDASGCAVTPSDEVLASLTAAQRVGLWDAMREYPQAVLQRAPFSRPLDRPDFIDDPRLPTAAREVIARGSFVHGGTRFFADLSWLCHRVPDEAGRAAFFRVLRARPGIDLSLRVRAGDDLDRVARWWATPGRVAAVRDRLQEALRDGSGRVPLRDVLPPMPRARLGTYPPRGTRYDCFWTALNFAAPTAEGGPMADRPTFEHTVAGWRVVPLDALRLGDALAFRRADGTADHAAVYLAEDFVLTKDGWSMHRPWEVARIGAVRAIYPRATLLSAYRRPE